VSRYVLFDVDGTLVDSNDAHARAWVEGLAEAGYKVPFDRVRTLIGKGGDKVLPELTGLAEESEEGQRISTRRREIFRDAYLPHLAALPGARDLVAYLKDHGHVVGIATSAKEEELQALLERAGVADLFEHRASSGDADRSKPDPDIIHAALARTHAEPSTAVMIGDTPYDITAATRAGVRTIAFRSGGWKDEDLRGAAAIYDDPAHLRREYAGSILAHAAPAPSG
jgi:HAD superfamily hydrolase (TIGR01509 family)